jgi:hypothetical protein
MFGMQGKKNILYGIRRCKFVNTFNAHARVYVNIHVCGLGTI